MLSDKEKAIGRVIKKKETATKVKVLIKYQQFIVMFNIFLSPQNKNKKEIWIKAKNKLL